MINDFNFNALSDENSAICALIAAYESLAHMLLQHVKPEDQMQAVVAVALVSCAADDFLERRFGEGVTIEVVVEQASKAGEQLMRRQEQAEKAYNTLFGR